jgi:hypothetical protein
VRWSANYPDLRATPTAGPRSRAERRRDTEHRLGHDIDVWVASASHTRDVSMIDGDVEVLEIDALAGGRGDRFAALTGFDGRWLV